MRWFLALLVWLALLPLAALASPQALRLAASTPEVVAWPAIAMLADPGRTLTLGDVLRREAEFTRPGTPQANLGPRADAVWLRLPVQVDPADDGNWVLDIDYPPLDRIDVFVVRDGTAIAQATLGDHLRFDQRPLPSRSHAMRLTLPPGQPLTLFLRVQTRSSMVVPLRLLKAELFHALEAQVQLVQGLLAGIALCLALYALTQWLGSRESMFLHYAVAVAGVALFSFSVFGLGAQHLWPGNDWLTDNAAPFFVLFGLGGTALLVDRLLDVRQLAPRLSLALRGIAAVSFVVPVLFAAGVASYRQTALAATLLSPMPILLAAGLAWRRAREGDEAARYVLIGWSAYAFGVLLQAGLLRGVLPSNVWTQHAFQLGWLCEMTAFLRVLGVRVGAIRSQVLKAQHERELMTRVAHTDPLTGLPNRRGLDLALRDALSQASADQGLAVYVIDLDGFKAVNDRLGHDAGDALLAQAAARLRARVRGRDLVARLGGDEFVVLAQSIADEAVAWHLGEKLVEAFEQPFELQEGHACRVGLTVGFALAPQDGVQAADLLKRADAAMYTGKQAGKGTVRRGGASTGLVGA